jgi:hypothetical protein
MEDPIMSQLDELSGETTISIPVRVANMTRHRGQSTLPNSPTLQDVRL